MTPAELLLTRTGRSWFWRFWEFIAPQIVALELRIGQRLAAGVCFHLTEIQLTMDTMAVSAEAAREPPPVELASLVTSMRREATESARCGFDNAQELWSNLDDLVAQLRVAGDSYILEVPKPPPRCRHPTFETMLSWDTDMPLEMKEELLLKHQLEKERRQEEIRTSIREMNSRDPFRGRRYSR